MWLKGCERSGAEETWRQGEGETGRLRGGVISNLLVSPLSEFPCLLRPAPLIFIFKT